MASGNDQKPPQPHSVPGSTNRLEIDFSDPDSMVCAPSEQESCSEGNVGDRKSKLRLSFGKSAVSADRPDASISSMKTSISLPIQMQSLEDIGFSTQIDRLQSRSLQTTGKLQISPDMVYEFTAEDLVDLGEIGRGNYGSVNKMMHKTSGTIMAVKRILSNVDEREQKELIELAVVMRSTNCVNIIQFFGAIFKDGDCWICMELMDTSLDKFYRFIYDVMLREIPEDILGKIAVAILNALDYLKTSLNIIHRDVKPSNVLLDKRGNIKLCDFGISGRLVDSIARTNVGCRPYMAPERIDPTKSQEYDIRADVWSLGITLMELAIGQFPYPIQEWDNVFKQLSQVVEGEPPRLNREKHSRFSDDFIDFVNTCLAKEVPKRPKYKYLLVRKKALSKIYGLWTRNHQFIKTAKMKPTDTRAYVEDILSRMEAARLTDLMVP